MKISNLFHNVINRNLDQGEKKKNFRDCYSSHFFSMIRIRSLYNKQHFSCTAKPPKKKKIPKNFSLHRKQIFLSFSSEVAFIRFAIDLSDYYILVFFLRAEVWKLFGRRWRNKRNFLRNIWNAIIIWISFKYLLRQEIV